MKPQVKAVPAADSDPAYELSPSGKTLLQERLALYALVVLIVAISYWPAFYFIWRAHPGVSDQLVLSHVFSPWTLALLLLHGALWVLCRGQALPRSRLPPIDLVYHTAVGCVFGGIVLHHPAPVVAPLEGLLALATVLGVRSLLVPSTGLRTACIGACMCLGPGLTLLLYPAHFSAEWMGIRTTGPLFANWAAVAISLTSVASMVLYGLRREVRDAQRLGQYTLVERIGEGGMGVVYRAEHALLRRPTAIKLLPPTERSDSAARFEREVQLMAELTHPNTVAIYDYGRTADGTFYYAMEHLDGVDLEGLVAIGGAQPAARVIHLLRQVCGSLEEAHRRGLIHRDIKPANLFLCRNRSEPDTVKVLDFGLAKEVAGDTAQLSAVNTVLGTPLYISPESLSRVHDMDGRSDLYSLGAVAYFLLTGTPVFPGKSAVEVCARHLHAEPDSLSSRLGGPVPRDLERLVLACLAKSPDSRPASARALRDALEGCADAHGWGSAGAEAWWGQHSPQLAQRRERHAAAAGSSAGRSLLLNLSRTEPAPMS